MLWGQAGGGGGGGAKLVGSLSPLGLRRRGYVVVGSGVALFKVVRVHHPLWSYFNLSILCLLMRLVWALLGRERLEGLVVPSWWEEYHP